ncbi:MAG: hypothetical protein K2J80_08395, partial [Oscillospiraceae bacterium]|nr:hypothetical protein [Oscillospiraceae bacterium]
MDENRNDYMGGEDDAFFPNDSADTYSQSDGDVYDGEYYDEDFEKTQEMNSIQLPKLTDDEYGGIMPRDEFTDLNSADDMS